MRKDLHLYAIGLRRCAEIRVGRKPPLPHTTSFSKVVPVSRPVYHERPLDGSPWIGTTYKTTMRKVEFKQTTWKGGRVLGPISSNSLAYLGVFVPRDRVKQIPAKLVNRVLEHFNVE